MRKLPLKSFPLPPLPQNTHQARKAAKQNQALQINCLHLNLNFAPKFFVARPYICKNVETYGNIRSQMCKSLCVAGRCILILLLLSDCWCCAGVVVFGLSLCSKVGSVSAVRNPSLEKQTLTSLGVTKFCIFHIYLFFYRCLLVSSWNLSILLELGVNNPFFRNRYGSLLEFDCKLELGLSSLPSKPQKVEPSTTDQWMVAVGISAFIQTSGPSLSVIWRVVPESINQILLSAGTQ